MTAPSQDREREAAAVFARLALHDVPDDAPVPLPPWRDSDRPASARRFGRATPWLVAAVLLVLAGLGVGAAVAFDAAAPDRAPVATGGPTPTATTTGDDGTLGTPTSTPSPSPTPSLDRGSGSNRAEQDTTSAPDPQGFALGIGSYGPVRVGLTEAQVGQALGGGAFTEPYGTCRGLPLDVAAAPYTRPAVITQGGVVVGVIPGVDATDAQANGRGSTLVALRAAYPAGDLAQSGGGWVFTVTGGGNGLGFVLDTPAEPAATDTVSSVLIGTADFARGFEVCSG